MKLKNAELDTKEWNKLVFDLNRTKVDHPDADNIYRLFDKIAEANSDLTAVVHNNQSITYGTLKKKADDLAVEIQESSVKPDTPIGIYIDRSIDYVISVLGVVKAGCAYVSLDPEYPIERLNHTINITDTPVIITNDKMLESIPDPDRRLINLNKINSRDSKPEDRANKENLAYLIFTSGSTGLPKGICIEHRNLLNLVNWHIRRFPFEAGTNVTQSARVGFDASVWEFWTALCSGLTLHILDSSLILNPEKLHEYYEKNNIKASFLPTPVAEMFMLSPVAPESKLKYLYVGGDRLTRRPAKDFSPDVVNLYGPSECTVIASEKVIEHEGEVDYSPTIGVPVDNTQIYILDEDYNVLSEGETGEIYIGGDCVGRGYYNQPEMTEKAYISNPLPGTYGEKLYKTGDLGKVLPNGEFDCIGRLDSQVKIRGYRIELGEIQSVILKQNKVKDCVVLVKNDLVGEKAIVAYIRTSDDFSLDDLKKSIAEELPSYMLPASYVILDEFKLTDNGKIDKKTLPEPDWNIARTDFVPPENDTQVSLAEIWGKYLKQDKIGITDNFYSLGGNSIIAAQIITAVNTGIDSAATIDLLLSNPTISDFSKKLNSEGKLIDRIPASSQNISPLSYSQHGLWYFWMLDKDRIDYNIPLRIDIRGEIDRSFLQQTFTKLAERHASLRTAFVTMKDLPFQVVNPPEEVQIDFTDISSHKNRMNKLKDIEIETGRYVFDLEKGNLFYSKLVKYDAEKFVLFLTIHHIITDGWSMGLFLREWKEIYSSLVEQRDVELPELTVSYGDYSEWSKKTTPAEKYEKQLNYWQEKLLPFPESLELPLKKRRPPVQTDSGKRYWWHLNTRISNKIREYAESNHISEYSVFLSALNIILSVYGASDDVVVGSPYAGRNHPDKQNIFGIFTNLLPIRSNLAENISFGDFAKKVYANVISAFSNSEYPFDELIKDLGYKPDRSRHPLFQAMFVFQNFPLPEMKFHNLEITMKEIGNNTSKLDFTLTVDDIDGNYECWIEYNTDILSDSLIESMADSFADVFDQVLNADKTPIHEVSVLNESEYKETIDDFNNTEKDFPLNKSYGEIFTERCRMFSDNIAIKMNDITITYAELKTLTDKWSRYFAANGTGKGDIVAVVMDRSPELYVALLSILRAGAAYMPLDAAYPDDRIEYMLNDSGAKLIVTDSENYTRIRGFDIKQVVYNVQLAEVLKAKLPEVKTIAGGEDVAYLIYTSGSTGKPKGVQVLNRGMLNHNLAVIDDYELTEKDRNLQFGSISFDLSVEEIFPTFLTGATLIPRTEEAFSSIPGFLRYVESEQITVLNLATAYWHELVKHLDEYVIPDCVRLVIIGGEKADLTIYNIWKEKTQGRIRLLNTYGPTETTIISTWYEPGDEDNDFPIGRPIANTQIYVLDRNMRPVPKGVSGELCIGGAGLAKGYLNDPEKTAKSFVKNPVTGKGLIYRTGDLVRINENNLLEIAGRIDFQVKIRGHRIEPGEIERLCRDYDGVSECIVVAVEDRTGMKQLIAYVLPEDNVFLNTDSLKAFMKDTLPSYMVPALIMIVDKFEYNTSGKINRKVLPEPVWKTEKKKISHKTGMIGQRLLQIVRDVLKNDNIDLDSSFFESGGHSLTAMQMISRIDKEFNVAISISDFMEHTSIRDTLECLKGILPDEITEKKTDNGSIAGVVKIWKEILKSDDDSPDSDFFENGGHSLTAMQLISRIEKEFNVNLSIHDFMNKSSLKDLIELVTGNIVRDDGTLEQTDVRADIIHVMEDVLKTDIDDRHDFFENGGNSLTAMQFIARVEKKFNAKLSLHDFLNNSTIDDILLEISHSEFKAETLGKTSATSTSGKEYLLTIQQEGLWFLWKMDKNNVAYNIPVLFEIKGLFDDYVMNKSLIKLMQRHEALRSVFFERNGLPVQKPMDYNKVDVEVIDVSKENWSDKEFDDAYREVTRHSFNLSEGPLFKIKVWRKSQYDHRMIICFHHIVLDGWSVSILINELTAIYTSFISNKSVKLIESDRTFADFVNKPVDRQRQAMLEKYWTGKLNPLPEPIDLPTQKERPAVQTTNGSNIYFTVNKDLCSKLSRLAREKSASKFMLLLSAFRLLLYKYTAQEDILIGSPAANRLDPDYDGVIGSFMDNQLYRIPVHKDDNVSDVIDIVRKETLDNLTHSGYPFKSIVDKMNPERDLSRHPLFQVMFVFQNLPSIDLDIPGLELKAKILANDTSKLDITMEIVEIEGSMHCRFEYNPDLFEAWFSEKTGEHYNAIISQMVSNSRTQIKNLGLLSDAEKELIDERNRKAEIKFPNTTIQNLIIDRIQDCQDRTAVKFGDTSITYGEFGELVQSYCNKVKHDADSRIIAVMMDRSVDLIALICAIQRVGAAYLYLDPEFPNDRLLFMAEDSAPEQIIIEKKYTQRIDFENARIWEDIKSEDIKEAENAADASKPDSIAYYIYTSGTTGKPKAVKVPHSAVTNFILSMQKEPGMTIGDKLLAVTPLSFDISVLEVFLPLVTGAELILASRDDVYDAGKLAEMIESEKITIMQATPSTWKMLRDIGWKGSETLKVLCGGEPVSYDLASGLLKMCGELWNMYGPTETTVWSVIHRILETDSRIYIGHAVVNTTLYVVDSELNPVPDGVKGELLIGGKGITAGYHNREDLTAQKFVDFTNPSGVSEIVYRTGDIVRFDVDGRLECFGRNDFQVKIRGHRIELGEIENELMKTGLFNDAVVHTFKDRNEMLQLCGYYIADKEISVKKIADSIANRLPDYMIPGVFLYMDEFPLTANGKIDRKKLPVPDATIKKNQDEIVKAGTPDQEVLCNIIGDVLGIDNVGINNNFFELGGNSVLSMLVINRLGQAGLSLKVQDLFRHKDLEELAGKLEQTIIQDGVFGDYSLVELQKGNSKKTPLYLVHPLPGDLLGYVNLIRHLPADLPIYGFQAPGLMNPDKALESVEETAAHYVRIIKERHPGGAVYIGGWCFGGTVAYEMMQQLRWKKVDVKHLFLFDTWAFRPVESLRKKYFKSKIKLLVELGLKETLRILKTKIRNRFGNHQNFGDEDTFFDQGMFANRSAVRKKNIAAVCRYNYRPCKGGVVLFKALQQPASFVDDPYMAWDIFVEKVQMFKINATHDTILKEPQVEQIAGYISDIID